MCIRDRKRISSLTHVPSTSRTWRRSGGSVTSGLPEPWRSFTYRALRGGRCMERPATIPPAVSCERSPHYWWKRGDRALSLRRAIPRLAVDRTGARDAPPVGGAGLLRVAIPRGLRKQLATRLVTRLFMLSSAKDWYLSLIHISEPTRLRRISYAVFCLKKKKKKRKRK